MATLSVIQADITALVVDAIVNAANQTLLGGGGVDGAIHRAAGPQLLQACRALQGCRTGQAKITAGYRLNAAWVIHTVGPVWQGGACREAELLASCYRESLLLARQYRLQTIAFPAISCGVYGYPRELAVATAVAAVRDFLSADEVIQEVIFCCFDAELAAMYRRCLADPAKTGRGSAL